MPAYAISLRDLALAICAGVSSGVKCNRAPAGMALEDASAQSAMVQDASQPSVPQEQDEACPATVLWACGLREEAVARVARFALRARTWPSASEPASFASSPATRPSVASQAPSRWNATDTRAADAISSRPSPSRRRRSRPPHAHDGAPDATHTPRCTCRTRISGPSGQLLDTREESKIRFADALLFFGSVRKGQSTNRASRSGASVACAPPGQMRRSLL